MTTTTSSTTSAIPFEKRPLCILDDSWEDILEPFKAELKKEGNHKWSCHCLDGVDKEVILLAPEVMDAKTDSALGMEKIPSLDFLIHNGIQRFNNNKSNGEEDYIPSAATLDSDEKILELLDLLWWREYYFLNGYPITQSLLSVFPYLLRLSLLKEQQPVVSTYCTALLLCVDLIHKAIFSSTIRSDEEFGYPPPELEKVIMEEIIVKTTVEKVLAELDKCVEQYKKEGKEKLASRFQLRKLFLSVLNTLSNVQRRSEVEQAATLSKEAVALLLKDVHQAANKENISDLFQRNKEPTVDEKFLREKHMAHWNSIITPHREIPTPSFNDTLQQYVSMFQHIQSFALLASLHSLTEVTEYVEWMGASATLLPVRCFIIRILFNKDYHESFLFGLPLPQQLLSQLAKEYGAPLYLKIYEGDTTMTDGVTRYRIHKSPELSKANLTPSQYHYLYEQTRDTVRKWVEEACKQYLLHLETMLCNRGLAHARLLKSFKGYGQFQEESYYCDRSVFMAGVPGVDLNNLHNDDEKKSINKEEMEIEFAKATTVLTLYANGHVLRCMELVLRFGFELNLYATGELIPVLWYLNFTLRAQERNNTGLYLQTSSSGVLSHIPEMRINKKSGLPLHNLALTTRQAGLMDPVRIAELEATRTLTDAVFISSNLFEYKGLIDLSSPPKHSLISLENMFNHRFLKYFIHVRTPQFAPYETCLAAKLDFNTLHVQDDTNKEKKEEAMAAKEKEILLYATRSSELAQQAVSSSKSILNSSVLKDTPRQTILKKTLTELERTAVTCAASLAAFAVVCEEEEKDKNKEKSTVSERYVSRVEQPGDKGLICFSFRKK